MTDRCSEDKTTSTCFFLKRRSLPEPTAKSEEVMTMNVSHLIRPHVAKTPRKTAILFEDREMSYAQLEELVTRVAHGVTKMGYRKGDVLSIFLPSRPELIVTYLGAARAGVTVNLVNAMLQKTEVAYILNDCGCRGVLTDAKRLPIVEAARPEATQASFDSEGWFRSGDVAYMDEDGYAYIVDRKKDMINVGGEKVFPSEVEDMMINHPKIKDIVIVGIADDLKGEAPKAFIVLREGEALGYDEIRGYCKTRMAPYKVPVAVEFMDEIPRLASGKALRRMLRDRQR